MAYGFKVYAVAANVNGRGAPCVWSDAVWHDVLTSINELSTSKPSYGKPRLREPAEGEPSEPWRLTDGSVKEGTEVFKLYHPNLVSENHVHFEVTSAKQGRHNDLFENDEMRNIVKAAAGARHRVDLWRGTGEDNTAAIMVVEAIDGHCPQGLVRQYLQHRSRERVMGPSVEGEKRKRTGGDYVGLRMAGHPDGPHLRQLVDRSETITAVYQDAELSARGLVKNKNGEVRIRVKGEKSKGAAVSTVNEWLDAQLKGESGAQGTDNDPVLGMMETFNVETSAFEELGLDVNHVELVMKPKGESPRIFAPKLIDQFFTYPVTTLKPNNWTYYGHVSGKVQAVQTEYHRGITVLAGRKVAECLTDSTWPPSSLQLTKGSATAEAPDVETG